MDINQLSKSELRLQKVKRNDFKNINRNDIYIILDSLKCAHNIGTILRLSDALLIKKVYICGDTIIPPNKKIKSSSRGAEKWVEWEYRKNILEVIQELKEKGIKIISAEIADNSIDYTKMDVNLPLALVFGREYDGVSKDVLNMSDCVVHLPILGMTNSINVSTTASVLMYYIYNKLNL